MDTAALARTIALLTQRLKKVEDALQHINTAKPDSKMENEFPLRESINLKEIEGISEENMSESRMLQSMYTSEHNKLTQFAVGTWPEEKLLSSSCVVHGCEINSKGQHIEILRAIIVPEFIRLGIPFSNVSVDPGEEINLDRVRSIINSAASHLILYTPNLSNYREAIMSAYLAGRGNTNIYTVKFDHNPYSFPGNISARNVIGPFSMHSHKDRVLEIDRILSEISLPSANKEYKTLFANNDDSFGKTVMYHDPETLGRVRTRDTKDRRTTWEQLLGSRPSTDIGILVALSFFGGMLSPSNTSRFTRVPPESLAESEDWLGLAHMVGLLDGVIQNQGDSDQSEVRDAILYFNHVVGPAFV